MGGAEDESGHRKISHGLVRNFRYKLAACRSNSGASRAILEAVANYYWHIIARLWVRLEARKNSPNPPFGAAHGAVCAAGAALELRSVDSRRPPRLGPLGSSQG
jgi:hypothetical protein